MITARRPKAFCSIALSTADEKSHESTHGKHGVQIKGAALPRSKACS